MCNKQALGQKGFTLIEAMIVIAIVAIVLSLAVPSFNDFFEKNRLKRAAEGVYGLITKARAEVVIRDADLSVSVDSGAWCAGYALAPNCDCTLVDPNAAGACAVPVAGTNVLQVVDGANFDGVNIAADFDTTFDAIDSTANNNDTVSLSAGNWSLNIIVSRLGRVRVCAPDADRPMGYSGC